MQRQPPPIFTGSATTASSRTIAPRSSPVRPALPDRDVTNETIERAFVQFILYCNPAVPLDTDTGTLREAFRTPPKSGGKSFNTFTLFELIKQLEAKELKTWAELALKLGVEPPDQDKGQSSQKIQQYAVRLKRWMHSMHVDAFFEYLLDRPNSYWTEVPSDTDSVSESVRDGVAAEDDMALRALLPHIRPRRGRRKPGDDDLSKSPSQRPSMEPPPGDDLGSMRSATDTAGAWSAHPDSRGGVFLFPVADPQRPGAGMGQQPGPPGPSWASHSSDVLQTPLTAYPQSAYPQSAITPSTRQAFWADEPKSAITPSKSRALNKRHGAKVVSSAWRSGLGGTGKTRGRPRLNRVSEHDNGPFSAFPTTDAPATFKVPFPSSQSGGAGATSTAAVPASVPVPTPASALPTLVESPVSMVSGSVPTTPVVHIDPALTKRTSTPTLPHSGPAHDSQGQNPRPAKRSRLSLQVPERVGGEVRLATPPPVVMVNGQVPTSTIVDHNNIEQQTGSNSNIPTMRLVHEPAQPTAATQPPQPPLPPFPSSSSFPPTQPTNPSQPVRFTDPTDRTNLDELEGFLAHEILTGDWFDAAGRPTAPCGADEAWAIVSTVVENLLRSAATRDGFLINIAALAGGKMLMSTTRVRVTRLGEEEEEEEEGEGAGDGPRRRRSRSRYRFAWELRLGDIRGGYSMEETVSHERWKKERTTRDEREEEEEGEDRTAAAGVDQAGKGGGTGGRGGGGEGDETEEERWRRKYMAMRSTVLEREQQLSGLRFKVMQALREPRSEET